MCHVCYVRSVCIICIANVEIVCCVTGKLCGGVCGLLTRLLDSSAAADRTMQLIDHCAELRTPPGPAECAER